MPNFGEKQLGVVLDEDGETMTKYQIGDVSRGLYSTTEMCDLETWKTTPFRSEKSLVAWTLG